LTCILYLLETTGNRTFIEDSTDADIVVDLLKALGGICKELELHGQVGDCAGVFAHDADTKRQHATQDIYKIPS
jgi:hypothetical protein